MFFTWAMYASAQNHVPKIVESETAIFAMVRTRFSACIKLVFPGFTIVASTQSYHFWVPHSHAATLAVKGTRLMSIVNNMPFRGTIDTSTQRKRTQFREL